MDVVVVTVAVVYGVGVVAILGLGDAIFVVVVNLESI